MSNTERTTSLSGVAYVARALGALDPPGWREALPEDYRHLQDTDVLADRQEGEA